jgi:hypothetical protein
MFLTVVHVQKEESGKECPRCNGTGREVSIPLSQSKFFVGTLFFNELQLLLTVVSMRRTSVPELQIFGFSELESHGNVGAGVLVQGLVRWRLIRLPKLQLQWVL